MDKVHFTPETSSPTSSVHENYTNVLETDNKPLEMNSFAQVMVRNTYQEPENHSGKCNRANLADSVLDSHRFTMPQRPFVADPKTVKSSPQVATEDPQSSLLGTQFFSSQPEAQSQSQVFQSVGDNKPKKKTTGPVHNSKYKAKMCKNWISKGVCPYYEKCQFAHGEHEMEKWATRRNKVVPTPGQTQGRVQSLRLPHTSDEAINKRHHSVVPQPLLPAQYFDGYTKAYLERKERELQILKQDYMLRKQLEHQSWGYEASTSQYIAPWEFKLDLEDIDDALDQKKLSPNENAASSEIDFHRAFGSLHL